MLKGSKHNPDTLKRISRSLMGITRSSETREKMSIYQSNRTKEHLEKLRIVNTGKKRSEETKKRISESKKGVFAGEKNYFYGMREFPKEWTEKRIAALPKKEQHWNWKGGINPISDTIRKSKEFKMWARQVKETWNFECQICGDRGYDLHSNHIKKFAEYKEDRFNINNGICLCKKCHTNLVNQHEKEWESYFNFCWENKIYQGGNL